MRDGAVIGPIIIAIGLIVAALCFAVVGALLQTADGRTELRLERAEAEIAQLRRGLDTLRSELRDAEAETERLEEEIALAASRIPAASAALAVPEFVPGVDEVIGAAEDLPGTEEMTEEMRTAKSRFNMGITQPGNRVMLEILGHPRSSYSTTCQAVTQPRLKALMETRQVGPIRVTMIRPALDSLQRVVDKLAAQEPDIYAALGTAGAICARLIRGSRSAVSNHSWGTAIDVKLQGQLDGFADGGTQFGLLLLAELFNEEGWYWGAGYRREDSMHFEVGVETLRKWQAEGLL